MKRDIDLSTLSTEEGVVAAAVTMATVVCQDVLWPVVNHTPKDQVQALFERFLSGITGAMCAELGPDKAKASLDAVKLAIDDLLAARAKH